MAIGTAQSESGPAPKPPPGKYVDYGQFIDGQLRTTRKQVKVVEIAGGLLTLAVAALALFLVAALLDHWILRGGLGFAGRLLFFTALVAGAAYYLVRSILPAMLGRVNPVYAAHTIERSTPSLKNSLINFLLFRKHRQEVPQVVYDALEEQAATRLVSAPIESVVDRTRLIHIGYVLVALAAALALYRILSPKNPLVTVARVVAPWADIAAPARVTIADVQPGSDSAYRGQGVKVSAEVIGLGSGDDVKLVYTTSDRQAVDRVITMYAPPDGYRHSATLPEGDAGVQQDIEYRIVAGDAASNTYRLQVVEAPAIVVESVDYKYPAYTGMEPTSARQRGDLKALEGTQVTLHGVANQPIKSAAIDFQCDGRADRSLQVSGENATASFALSLNEARTAPQYDSYQLRFVNMQGVENPQPIRHRIDVLADLAPEVSFLAPLQEEVAVPIDGQLTIEVRAIDPDFALATVALRAKTERGELLDATTGELLTVAPHRGPFVGKYVFAPAKLGLKEGDVVRYSALAVDNKTPEPNSTATTERRIRVVSPENLNQRRQQNQFTRNDRRPDQPPDEPQRRPNDDRQSSRQQQPQYRDQQNPDQQPLDGQSADRAADRQQPDQANQRQDENRQQNKPADDHQQKSDGSDQQQGDGQQQQGAGEQQQGAGDKQGDQQGGQSQDQQPGGQQQRQPGGAQSQDGQKGAGRQQQQGGSQQGDSKQNQGDQQQPGSAQPDQQSGGDGQSALQQQSGGQRNGRGGQQADKLSDDQSPVPADGSDDGRGVERLLKDREQQGDKLAGESPKSGNQTKSGDRRQQSGRQQDGSESQTKSPQQPSDASDQLADSRRQGSEQDQATNQPDAGSQSGDQQRRPTDQSAGERDRSKPQPSAGGEQGAREQQENQQNRSGVPQRSDLPESAGKSDPQADAAKGRANPGQDPHGDQNKQDAQNGQGDKQQDDSKQPGQSAPQQNPRGSAGAGQDNPDDKGSPTPQQGAKAVDKRPSDDGQQKDGDEGAQSPSQTSRESDSRGQDDGDKSGGGGKGGGQNADQKGTGGAGKNTANDRGAGAANQEGKGEISDKAGRDQKADRPTGESGDERGPGSQTRPGEDATAKSSESGAPPDRQHSADDQQQGQQPGGEKSGQESDRRTTGSDTASGGTGGGGQPHDNVDSPLPNNTPTRPDDPNLAYAKKATELALDHLRDALRRGKDGQELLGELGWSRAEAEAFMRRQEQRLRDAQRPNPDDEARRQAEDALLSLGLRPERTQSGGTGVTSDSQRGLSSGRRTAPPPDYAEQYKAYTQGINQSSGQ